MNNDTAEMYGGEGNCFVFVYGTLMRGERAHSFLSGAEYAGEYMLIGYDIYDLGRYPGIVPAEGGTVFGEAYRVDKDMLTEMDAYEGEGSLYFRRTVTVENELGRLEAFVYVYARPISGKRIESGKWKER